MSDSPPASRVEPQSALNTGDRHQINSEKPGSFLIDPQEESVRKEAAILAIASSKYLLYVCFSQLDHRGSEPK